jgi:hypothetical protein
VPRKATHAKPGRPAAAIDFRVVEAMASVGATNVEIADVIGVDESTVRLRCADVLAKARATLKTRLRRAQITAALGGNPAMLIWLGKQMLDQKDKAEVDNRHGGADGGPIRLEGSNLEDLDETQLAALAAKLAATKA